MMKNNRQENNITGSHLRRYSSKSDDSEGCEGNEGSTEDRWLTILFSIRELVQYSEGLLSFLILFISTLIITLLL